MFVHKIKLETVPPLSDESIEYRVWRFDAMTNKRHLIGRAKQMPDGKYKADCAFGIHTNTFTSPEGAAEFIAQSFEHALAAKAAAR